MSTAEMLRSLNDLMDSLPSAAATSPLPFPPCRQPPTLTPLSSPPHSDDEDSSDDGFDDGVSDFIVSDVSITTSDDDYYPALDVYESGSESLSASDTDDDGESDSDMEGDSMSEINEAAMSAEEMDKVEGALGTKKAETSSIAVSVDDGMKVESDEDSMIYLTDSDVEANPYVGLGDCAEHPITLD